MEKFKFLPKNKTSKLPEGRGVYCFKNKKGSLLYVGKARNIKERVKNHFQRPTSRDDLFINQASKIGYIKTDLEIEALLLEANLIKKYQPKYNVIWRDDKNYFFVAMTKEDFPRIFWTHQTKVKSQKSKVKSQFIGPFVDGKALKQALKVLRKVFPYRSCYKIPNRPCLWYHLNRCPAPCFLKSRLIKEIPPDSLKLKKVSQRNAKNLMKIIKEGKNPVLKNLKKEMKLASKNQDFEEAAKIRDQINSLERVVAHAKIFESGAPQKFDWPQVQKILQKILKTKNKILRIEAYDVSNIVGQEATGSTVTFINGLPDKNFYRKFKIKIQGKPNDTAMIKEIISRRLRHPEWGWPDLILIDGGIGQLNAALKVKNLPHTVPTVSGLVRGQKSPKQFRLQQDATGQAKIKKIKVMSLAKRENKLFIEGKKEPILLKNMPREVFNLILQLRDEAHRFAISYHRKLRKKVLVP